MPGAGFQNSLVYGENVDFSGAAVPAPRILTNGQMLIGSTALNAGGTHINVGTFTSPLGTLNIGYSSPNVTIDVAGSGGPAIQGIHPDVISGTGVDPVVPDAFGNIFLEGITRVAGAIPIQTNSNAPSAINIEIQLSQATASATPLANGISHFDSSQFSVDSDGFVTLTTAPIGLTSITGDDTLAVVPDGGGNINLFGNTVLNGTNALPVFTRIGGDANTEVIDVQIATTLALVDATINDAGLASFNENDFRIDTDTGFVSAALAAYFRTILVQATAGTGVNPVRPTNAGLVDISGLLVAAGTNPIQTVTNDVNAFDIQVQVSQAVAAPDSTKVGLANFDSSQFDVDANGFVSLTGSTPSILSQSEQFDDLIWTPITTLASNSNFVSPFMISVSGGVWTHTNDTDHPGILNITRTGNLGGLLMGANQTSSETGVQVGMYKYTVEFMVRMNQLSSSDPNFNLTLGLCNQPVSPLGSARESIYFDYNHAVNGGAWTINTQNNNGIDVTIENSTVLADTDWHRYTIVVNSAGTSVAFFIDGVECTNSPITTTIPLVQLYPVNALTSNSGTASKSIDFDYWYSKQEFSR